MRSWRSNKVVEAEQIMEATAATTGGVILKLSDDTSWLVDDIWVAKHSNGQGPQALLLGWFVRYPDSYESWHPQGYEETHERMRSWDVMEMHPSVQHIIQFFAHMHLPPALAEVSRPYYTVAMDIAARPNNAETTVALRKLLESKDAAVRAEVARQS